MAKDTYEGMGDIDHVESSDLNSRLINHQGAFFSKGKWAVKTYTVFKSISEGDRIEYINDNLGDLIKLVAGGGATGSCGKGTLRDVQDGSHMIPHLGMGFAIISEDKLKLSMWGGGMDSSGKPNPFDMASYGFNLDHRDGVLYFGHEEGPVVHSVWDNKILKHEMEAWSLYLKNKDKNEYVNNLLPETFLFF